MHNGKSFVENLNSKDNNTSLTVAHIYEFYKIYLLFLETHGRAPLLFCTVPNNDPDDCALIATGFIGRESYKSKIIL